MRKIVVFFGLMFLFATSVYAQQVTVGGSGKSTPTLADVTISDTIIDKTLTDTATSYSQLLPAKCVAYEFQVRGTGIVDFAMTDTGLSGNNWQTIKTGGSYRSPSLGLEKIFSGTVYFKCPLTAGEIIEIRLFTKP